MEETVVNVIRPKVGEYYVAKIALIAGDFRQKEIVQIKSVSVCGLKYKPFNHTGTRLYYSKDACYFKLLEKINMD